MLKLNTLMDYYKILGVSPNATLDEIKKAYRKLARRLHPDLQPKDSSKEEKDAREKKIAEVNTAYEVLSDSKKRSMFDQGIDPLKNSNANATGGSFFQTDDMGDIFSDIASAFFGGGSGAGFSANAGFGHRKKTYAKDGDDIILNKEISLKDSIFGVEIKVKYNFFDLCEHCKGELNEPGTKIIKCPECDGNGMKTVIKRTLLGQMQTVVECSKCLGTGEFIEKLCKKCKGTGVRKSTIEKNIKIPAGIKNDMLLNIQDDGNVGVKGGVNGDLKINIRILKDKYFSRNGNDLHTIVSIPFWLAILGGDKEIKTFDGEQNIKIPHNSKFGQIIELKNLGSTILNNKNRGSLFVHLNIEIPEKISKKQTEILKEYFEENIKTLEPNAPV
jgi:molecular chaperone DnaJ